jgi:hypothetical protein
VAKLANSDTCPRPTTGRRALTDAAGKARFNLGFFAAAALGCAVRCLARFSVVSHGFARVCAAGWWSELL